MIKLIKNLRFIYQLLLLVSNHPDNNDKCTQDDPNKTDVVLFAVIQ